MDRVTVIIPVYNEENFIINAVESLLNTKYPRDLLEFILVDGGSTDNTVQQIKSLQQKYEFIRLLYNPQRIVPIALNLGIENASGEIIIRADAHSTYSPGYIDELVKWLKKLDAGNVGGRFVHSPTRETRTAIAIAKVLESRFGVGNASFRLEQSDQPIEVDTVPYGCWKKDIFERVGLFDPRLERVQDLEMNKRIIRSGKKIYLLPWIKIFYHPRETYFEFAKNYFRNGYWNILTVFYTRTFNNLSLRHYIPLLFVLAIIVPLIAGLLWWKLLVVSLFVVLLYFIFTLFFAIKVAKGTRTTFIHVLLAFFAIHFSYGLGELYAMLKLPFIKR